MLHFFVIRNTIDRFTINMMPPQAEGVPTVLINVTSPAGIPPTYEVKIAGAGQQFRRKQTLATVLAEFEDIGPANALSCEISADEYLAFSLVDVNEGPLIQEAITQIISAIEDGNDHKNLDAILAEFTNNNTFKRRRIDGNDGYGAETTENMTGVPNDPGTGENPGAAATTATTVNFFANTPDAIIALIQSIDPAIKYLGFDAKRIRKQFLSTRPDNNVAARELILIFAGYAHVGNNSSKLNTKRVDLAISRSVMQQLTNMGVLKKASDPDTMTLARAGIAFMPDYLIYRKFLTADLQNQTDSAIEVIYKDICFYGCPEIRNRPGYAEFHKEFSSYIYKPGEEIALDDKKFLSNYKKWNKVAEKGYKNDKFIHSKMADAINVVTGTTPLQALELIVNNLQTYRNQP